MGLLKTAATAAVASSVHGRVQRRQQARWAAQDQRGTAAAPPPSPAPPAPATPAGLAPAPAPAPPAPAAPDQPVDMGERLAQLAQLGELMKAGLLTEAEFEQQKALILNG